MIPGWCGSCWSCDKSCHQDATVFGVLQWMRGRGWGSRSARASAGENIGTSGGSESETTQTVWGPWWGPNGANINRTWNIWKNICLLMSLMSCHVMWDMLATSHTVWSCMIRVHAGNGTYKQSECFVGSFERRESRMRLSNLVKNLKLHKQPILKQGLDMLGVNLMGFTRNIVAINGQV